jgi:ATP-dependent DNA ligase
VLDGELAIFDEQLRSRFDSLREPDPDAVASPPVFVAFDVLYRDGRHVRRPPLRDRRENLEEVLVASDLIFAVRRLPTDGWRRGRC